MSLKMVQRKTGSVVILDLAGKVILGEPANQLLETTKALVSQGERNLLFNLADVSYLDSAGLGIVVKCYKAATEKQGRIKLLGVPQNIRDLLRITKLQSFFELHDDEAAAVQSFG
jgi:anti-sigma B factor antagonist